jgi:integrase
MAIKVKHLLVRDGRHWARMSVPEQVRHIIGKTELLTALGPDRREALRQLPGAVADMQSQLDAARIQIDGARPAPRGRPMTLPAIARAHYADRLYLDSEFRNHPRYASVGINDGYVADLKRAIAGNVTNDELAEIVGEIVEAFRARGNLAVEPYSREWREVARTLAGIEMEVLRRVFERDEGDFSGAPTHPALTIEQKAPVQGDPLAPRIMDPERSCKTLSELAVDFVRERGASSSVNRETDVAVRMLEENFGEQRAVYTITRKDVIAFKRVLAEVPRLYANRFPQTALPDAIRANKARSTPYPAIDVRTGGKYLAHIHSILGWCVRNDILPDNPASGIKPDAVRERSQAPRVNFSPGDLTKIFGSERYDTSKVLIEAQWAELISLFTGMRASELAQIKLDSVRTERGVLVFRVEERTKNRGSQRLIPVHAKLLELGLERHIQELRRKGAEHLFPAWYKTGMAKKVRADKGDDRSALNDYFSTVFPRSFNRTVLPKLGINGGRKSWHSFRHCFRTGLSMAGVEKSIGDALAGHADGSMAATYVHAVSVEKLKDAIDKLQFDGFAL